VVLGRKARTWILRSAQDRLLAPAGTICIIVETRHALSLRGAERDTCVGCEKKIKEKTKKNNEHDIE